jgi:hypothetical protein
MTTFIVGEEHPPTAHVGEHPTTLVVGEEGRRRSSSVKKADGTRRRASDDA